VKPGRPKLNWAHRQAASRARGRRQRRCQVSGRQRSSQRGGPCQFRTGKDSGIAANRAELSSGYIGLDDTAAERRETFGCVRGTRGARHLASKTRVNALMTQRARRLRGALRPMTQQYGSRNNVTISMPDGGSVPIVSQTEIDPMKMALPSCSRSSRRRRSPSRCPCRSRQGPGGSCPARVHCKRLILHAVVWRAGDDRQAAGTCPWGRARERQLLPAQRQMTGLNCSPVCVLCGLQG